MSTAPADFSVLSSGCGDRRVGERLLQRDEASRAPRRRERALLLLLRRYGCRCGWLAGARAGDRADVDDERSSAHSASKASRPSSPHHSSLSWMQRWAVRATT